MCRSITYRYSICTHSWRPYVIRCPNPIKDTSTDIDSTNICPAYKIRYERKVIKSGNGLCAACWEKQEKREEDVRQGERILEEKMRERNVGKAERGLGRRFWKKNGEASGGEKEKEDARILEYIDAKLEVVLEERVGNLGRDNEESENLLQEREKQMWIMHGNGGVRKKLDGNERKGVRNR
ncbi:hypothetical protein BELL_0460g00060 [Botrytis elliptica]|uniref:Uncharacterized protein n=1 Tax=Botrytis elliptica TaxID=278938 RepID=A0A4Z1JLL8_9HELO|nr:hypothetical protein EAE99_002978 [Botrytis elliptica]TGO72390.1 hypothetical protein BELL_0460g00060 [Botrytis elliptica]